MKSLIQNIIRFMFFYKLFSKSLNSRYLIASTEHHIRLVYIVITIKCSVDNLADFLFKNLTFFFQIVIFILFYLSINNMNITILKVMVI